jgi:hypothetical protein
MHRTGLERGPQQAMRVRSTGLARVFGQLLRHPVQLRDQCMQARAPDRKCGREQRGLFLRIEDLRLAVVVMEHALRFVEKAPQIRDRSAPRHRQPIRLLIE